MSIQDYIKNNNLVVYEVNITDTQLVPSEINGSLLAAINGKNKQEMVDAIQKEMDKRIKAKHGDDGDDGGKKKKTKCMVI